MSAIVTKATGILNNAIAKSTQLANQAVYWTKVSGEVGKIVYQKEGLAPPSSAQFQQVYKNVFNLAQSPALQKDLLSKAMNFTPSRNNAVKAGVYGVQLLAFFSLGEIIGRRSIFGYPSTGEHHH